MWLSQDSKPSKLYCHTSGGKLFYRTKTHKMHLDRLLFRNSRYLNSEPAPSHIATNKLRSHGTWHIDDILGILIIILKTPPSMAFRMTNMQPPSSKHPGDNLFDQGGTTNDRAAHRALAGRGWRERRRILLQRLFYTQIEPGSFSSFVFFGGWHNSAVKRSGWHEWLSFPHAIVHVSYIYLYWCDVSPASMPKDRELVFYVLWTIWFCESNGSQATSPKFGRETTGMIPEVH